MHTQIMVQVQPNASRDEVKGFQDGILRVRIAAPPVEGKANKRLIEFLSEVLHVPKTRITLKKGLSSKRKSVTIEGLTMAEISERVNSI